jgi:hypothetical protein
VPNEKEEAMTMRTILDIDENIGKELLLCTTIGVAPKDHQNVIVKIIYKNVYGEEGKQYFVIRKDLLAKIYVQMVEYEDNAEENRR